MKYLAEESGIIIDNALRTILLRAVQMEGKQSKLSRAIGVTENCISNWLGNTMKDTASITWDKWKKVRTYLIKAELIDADDPRWMLPSQMRERLMAIRGEGDGTSSHSAVNNGTNNGSMTVNNQTTDGSEPVKSALRSAVLKSDMCSDCKVKIFTMLETF